MKLLVILFSLLSERFLIHQISFRRFHWFNDYYNFLEKKFAATGLFHNPWLQIILIVLPVTLIVGFVYLLLGSLVFGFGGFLLSLAIFFYCLGPQNIFYPIAHSETDRQLFALVFWYLIGGPLAAVAYRMITLSCSKHEIATQANELADSLEWIPARITALLYLVVGNFQRGLIVFRRYALAKPELNHELLGECGLQAAKTNDLDPVTLIDAENLIEHAIILTLVVVAFCTLISWL